MKALLFELGVEEIPARLLSRAHRELGERLIKALAGANLEYADLRTFNTTPLALSISIADAQPDTVEERLDHRRGSRSIRRGSQPRRQSVLRSDRGCRSTRSSDAPRRRATT